MGIVRASHDSCNNAVEDQRAVGVAACPPSRQGLGNRLRDGENPPRQRGLVLRVMLDIEENTPCLG